MVDQLHAESLHALEIKTLRAYTDTAVRSFESLLENTGLDASRLRRALEWLLTRNAVEVIDEETRRYVSLTEIGREYALHQIPELRIIEKAAQGVTMKELQSCGEFDPAELSPAVGALKKDNIIDFGEGGTLVIKSPSNMTNCQKIQELINQYMMVDERLFDDLSACEQEEIEVLSRKRGKSKGIFRICDRVFKTYRITQTGQFLLSEVIRLGLTGEEVSRVSPDHLKDGAWRRVQFRRYALDLNPPRLVVGKRNPYREFLDYVKYKLLALGFEEMTGDHVEPEFWNMDALFMPQFHSARDIHDVYFIKEPNRARHIEEPFFSRVAEAHANGGETGSTGWGYSFDHDMSRTLVLRSQGTALSARTLHKATVPGKYFAMARCFRYDSVDATHAADFFQVEGIVLAQNNTFCTLLGLLKLFATEVAKADDIRFVPGYFPFTEPSVEAHIRHPKLGWIEMGGAGIFRPEVTIPQGVDVPVIAWGLGLDRMAMVAMGINDIRDLFATDLNKIRSTLAGFER